MRLYAQITARRPSRGLRPQGVVNGPTKCENSLSSTRGPIPNPTPPKGGILCFQILPSRVWEAGIMEKNGFAENCWVCHLWQQLLLCCEREAKLQALQRAHGDSRRGPVAGEATSHGSALTLDRNITGD